MLKWLAKPSARGTFNADDGTPRWLLNRLMMETRIKTKTFLGLVVKGVVKRREHDQKRGSNLLASRVSAEGSAQASEGTADAASLVRHRRAI